MNKRLIEMEEQSSVKKRRKPRLKLLDAPPINSIEDLIEISNSIKFYKNIDITMLWRIKPYLMELNEMVGMKELKESIFYQIIYYMQNMHKKNESEEYLHTILAGPPGTGKTTVALIIAKIYQGMGILSRDGPFKIAHRDDFIAGYLGQTAIKTQNLLKSCIGGVLFIDEVYSLAPKKEDKDSFSKEALDIICSFLSEHKHEFCCIAAGYQKDIEDCLFNMNHGLKRRFQWYHTIDDYSIEDLALIFIKMVKKINWELVVTLDQIKSLLDQHKSIFKYAGGDIENFITKCKITHSYRVLNLDKEHKFILTIDDLENGIKLLKKNKKNDTQEDDIPPYGMYT